MDAVAIRLRVARDVLDGAKLRSIPQPLRYREQLF
jgi:hypothetical protein